MSSKERALFVFNIIRVNGILHGSRASILVASTVYWRCICWSGAQVVIWIGPDVQPSKVEIFFA
jgi:hypothetical protein